MGEILAAVLAMAAIATIVYVAYLTVEALFDWYRQFEGTLRYDDNKEAVSVAVADAFERGACTYYQGIWDKSAKTMDALRQVKAERVDPELKQAHDESAVIVWQ
jgi:hypothetical protein